jgi:hypothetical protein
MADSPLVPIEILDRLSALCLALPESYEEPAWIGVRWRIRGRTFAHVASIAEGSPTVFARAAGLPGPLTCLTFRADVVEVEVLGQLGLPFYRPGWGANVVGLVLTAATDWADVGELVTDSYCVQAPRKLSRRVRGIGS